MCTIKTLHFSFILLMKVSKLNDPAVDINNYIREVDLIRWFSEIFFIINSKKQTNITLTFFYDYNMFPEGLRIKISRTGWIIVTLCGTLF